MEMAVTTEAGGSGGGNPMNVTMNKKLASFVVIHPDVL
jgi:hypothetical protein